MPEDRLKRVNFHDFLKVLSQITNDIKTLHWGSLPVFFKASWVLIVTWEKLGHSTQNAETKGLVNIVCLVL